MRQKSGVFYNSRQKMSSLVAKLISVPSAMASQPHVFTRMIATTTPFFSQKFSQLCGSSRLFDLANYSKAKKRSFLFPIIIQKRSITDRREVAGVPLKDMGTQGETAMDIDILASKDKESMYPDENTPNMLFNGIKFKDIPICHIKSSPNNTIIHITDNKGETLVYRSCGMEGFKNTRKGTNIAAQTTAITVSSIARSKGLENIRVKIQGLGPGRMSSIKGLQMGGMKIVSLTDATPISFNPPRPKKARRL